MGIHRLQPDPVPTRHATAIAVPPPPSPVVTDDLDADIEAPCAICGEPAAIGRELVHDADDGVAYCRACLRAVAAGAAIGRTVPPTHAGAMPARRTIWPVVIGIMCLLSGVPGTCSGGISTLTSAAARDPAMITTSTVAFGLSIWLTVASIGLMRRRPNAVNSLRWWAWSKIGASMVMGLMVAAGVGSVMQQINEQMPIPGDIKSIAVLLFVLFMVLMVSWPICILSWLSKPRVREEIAAWR